LWPLAGACGRYRTARFEAREQHMPRRLLGTIFVLAVLFGFLGVSIWFMITAWNSIEGPMGVHQWIAMFLGVFFSCLVGFGLMGLIFYSSRKGYDEPPTFVQQDDDPDERQVD
jgi:hypothetical protein